MLDTLPNELIFVILNYLSVRTLGRLASVCKRLRAISEDDSLWENYLKHDTLSEWWDITQALQRRHLPNVFVPQASVKSVYKKLMEKTFSYLDSRRFPFPKAARCQAYFVIPRDNPKFFCDIDRIFTDIGWCSMSEILQPSNQIKLCGRPVQLQVDVNWVSPGKPIEDPLKKTTDLVVIWYDQTDALSKTYISSIVEIIFRLTQQANLKLAVFACPVTNSRHHPQLSDTERLSRYGVEFGEYTYILDPNAWNKLFHLTLAMAINKHDIYSAIHEGTTCQVCGEHPIRGVIYTCTVCKPYHKQTLCGACYSSKEAARMHRCHSMSKLYWPLSPEYIEFLRHDAAAARRDYLLSGGASPAAKMLTKSAKRKLSKKRKQRDRSDSDK